MHVRRTNIRKASWIAQCSSSRSKAPLRYAFGRSSTSTSVVDRIESLVFLVRTLCASQAKPNQSNFERWSWRAPAGRHVVNQICGLSVGAQDAKRAAAEPERTCCLLDRLVQRRASCRAAPEKGSVISERGDTFCAMREGWASSWKVAWRSTVEYCRLQFRSAVRVSAQAIDRTNSDGMEHGKSS